MLRFFRLSYLFLILLALSLLLAACGDSTATPMQTTAAATPTLQPVATTAPTLTTAEPFTVALDPGHGGNDWGAGHFDSNDQPDLLEKDLTLQLSMATATLLRQSGFKVVLTRSGDTLANNPPQDLNGDDEINELDDLQARLNLANNSKADLLLSLHINSSTPGDGAGGFETWYCADRSFEDRNKLFAQLIQQESVASMSSLGYEAQDRRVADDLEIDWNGNHLFMFGPPTPTRKIATAMPGALTEALFITNDTEANLLRDNKTIKALAEGYTRAIQQYFARYKV
ncbi:MAG: N-acetylmuramoyl-L-alanine amidase [Chloroflexi bacterium]|uniref:N-acetylmuramoyl-L-alanine amidase n=1 Tax=Candidatus Chlorohelix allophototropha TaxID=3003348 RepID=A0A8T7M1R1_9CHLR|nr:N-acetylmuramoyl-L-alanine amidase [Chloroflexota bacterium]WJW67900.1 N-acetylmuramoyl-L-alanine amidase [Chloroflexota bacterium L227-S17]